MDLSTPLQFVRGIGPVRAEMLRSRGLETVLDLLYHLPFRYEDRREIKDLRSLVPGEKVTVLARVERGSLSRFRNSAAGVFDVTLGDGLGTLEARWFNNRRLAEVLVPGVRLALFGKVETGRRNALLMVQPEFEILDENEDDESLHTGRIVPIYEAIAKISTRIFRTLFHRILAEVELPADPLPEEIRSRLTLPKLSDALLAVHQPEAAADLRLLNDFRSPSQFRLIFDEFFWLECGLALKRTKARKADGIAFPVTARAREQIKKMLPFKPTGAQRRVIQEIVDDMKEPYPMYRLLQGDVGSGKTIVSGAGRGDCDRKWLSGCGVGSYGNSCGAALRLLPQIAGAAGLRRCVIDGVDGQPRKAEAEECSRCRTSAYGAWHARFAGEDVAFSQVGLAIVDEQHRFGGVQRLTLFDKGTKPDVLVMTATPIPRTLALTLYGDLEISSIDELPPGRKPITTRHVDGIVASSGWTVLSYAVRKGSPGLCRLSGDGRI